MELSTITDIVGLLIIIFGSIYTKQLRTRIRELEEEVSRLKNNLEYEQSWFEEAEKQLEKDRKESPEA